MSETDSLDYLQPDFEPTSLTVPRLRSILVYHNVYFPSAAKKPQLISILQENVLPNARKILAQRSRAKRSSKGIEDADSQEAEEEEEKMPPPPTPKPRRGKVGKVREEESESDVPLAKSPVKKEMKTPRRGTKHARAEDTETGTENEAPKTARRGRKSELSTPRHMGEDTLASVPKQRRPDLGDDRRESFFTKDNPFQSGSSPPVEGRSSSGEERRKRKSVPASISKDARRKSLATPRRKTDGAKGDDGFHPPTSAKFEIPVSELKGLRDYDENGVEASEEFTPEAQLELMQERPANGPKALVPRRASKKGEGGMGMATPIWMLFIALLGGYATWYRQEKLAVGYCGVGREPTQILPANLQVPNWVKILLEPDCEPCPQHSYCSDKLITECERDYVLKQHPLSLGGLVPIPPTCEPDGEKQRRIKTVADRGVELLRERRADFECGTLTNAQGFPEHTVGISEESLKAEVSKQRRKGLREAEFEDLWSAAIGEIKARDEVESVGDGPSPRLSSTSHARLPLTCALRLSLIQHLVRHRLLLTILITSLSLIQYFRSRLRRSARIASATPSLVSLTLEKLALQAALHKSDPETYEESWVSVSGMRDDVLRDVHSLGEREATWKAVQRVVEGNSNVRAAKRMGGNGEVGRVWEWIGVVDDLDEDGDGSGLRRRRKSKGGRVSWGDLGDGEGSSPAGNGGEDGVNRWSEARPIY